MGQSPTSTKPQVELTLSHPRFMHVKVIPQADERTLEISMGVDDKAYQKWQNQLKHINLNSQFLLLPTKHSFSTKGLCGSAGTLTLNYPDYPYLLTEEMYTRKGKKSRFQEVELWYLLYGLLMAKKQISPHSGKVGDIRPHNIFLNQKAQLRVTNVFSWPNQSTNFQKAFDSEISYLAPEEVKLLETGPTLNDNYTQQELYSIGLTLLSVATLTDCSDLYNLKTNQFDYKTADGRIMEWKQSFYSEVLRGVVANLCDFNQDNRMNTQQVTEWISKYSVPIRKKQNFVITQAPQKLHNSVKIVRESHPQIPMIPHLYQQPPINTNIKTTQSIYTPIPAYLIHGAPVKFGTTPPSKYNYPNDIKISNEKIPSSKKIEEEKLDKGDKAEKIDENK